MSDAPAPASGPAGAPAPGSSSTPAAAVPADSPVDQEECQLLADPRLADAITLFNRGEWYACHDGFEALWLETQGPVRPVLQGILQIAVAHLHLERGNRHGATVLMGEGLGRLAGCGDQALGISLSPLREAAAARLQALQQGLEPADLPLPSLEAPLPHRR